MSFIISSHLDPPKLLEKIQSGVDKQGFLFFGMFSGDNSILGKFKGNSFRLFKRRYYGNSFAPFCYGKIVSTNSGSEIIADIRMHPFVIIFMTIWFLGTGIGAFGLLRKLLSENFSRPIDQSVIIPLSMVFFGVVLVVFCRWLARNEGPFIKDYLNKCAGEDIHTILPMKALPLAPKKLWPIEFLIRRGAALLWDSVLPSIPYFLISALSPSRKFFGGLTFVFFWFIYDVTTLRKFGAGFGKKMAQLKVNRKSGGPLSNSEIIIRALVKTACLSPLYLLDLSYAGYTGLALTVLVFGIPYFLTKDHLALHDMVAGTIVTLKT